MNQLRTKDIRGADFMVGPNSEQWKDRREKTKEKIIIFFVF